jgi:hypothetical protein
VKKFLYKGYFSETHYFRSFLCFNEERMMRKKVLSSEEIKEIVKKSGKNDCSSAVAGARPGACLFNLSSELSLSG